MKFPKKDSYRIGWSIAGALFLIQVFIFSKGNDVHLIGGLVLIAIANGPRAIAKILRTEDPDGL